MRPGDKRDAIERWHKSSHSAQAGSCVEVAGGETVLVRDSKNRERGRLACPARAWASFLRDLTAGRP